MSLSQDRDTKQRINPELYNLPVAGGKLIYAGALVALNATGYLEPMSAKIGLITYGRAEQQVDNTAGADGALSCDVRRGVFRWANSSSGDAIAETDVGEKCYGVDDQTLAKTSNAGTRSVAGIVYDVDSQGVWLDTRVPGDLRKTYINVNLADLISADATVYHFISPVAGRITKVSTDLSGALATGNATATLKVGANAVTNGVVTMVQAGSVAGQVNSIVPTNDGTNAVDAGSDCSLTIGGTNTANKSALATIEITRN